jgi:hypothetical protein
MQLHAAPFPGHLHIHRLGSSYLAPRVQIRRLVVLSCMFSSGYGGSFPLFGVRHVALNILLPSGSSAGSSARLDASPFIYRPLSATVLSTLSQLWSGSFPVRVYGVDSYIATALPSRLFHYVLAAWCNGVGGSGDAYTKIIFVYFCKRYSISIVSRSRRKGGTI